jgi:hypothetical protein
VGSSDGDYLMNTEMDGRAVQLERKRRLKKDIRKGSESLYGNLKWIDGMNGGERLETDNCGRG